MRSVQGGFVYAKFTLDEPKSMVLERQPPGMGGAGAGFLRRHPYARPYPRAAGAFARRAGLPGNDAGNAAIF